MNEVVEPQVVSPSELLRLRQDHWGRALRSVSLVAEYTADADDTEQTLGVLGRLFRLKRSEVERAKYMRAWPAVHVMSTTMVAVEHYEQRTFWPMLSRLAGVENDTSFQAEWGRAYLDNLVKLGLPTFEDSVDAGTKYVGRILMHCGIPTSSLRDYFQLVADRRRIVPGLSAEEFVSWATQAKLPTVDRPVIRFLKYGGEFAVDVADRTFDLLDVVSNGGDGQLVPLPERFRVEALKLHRQGGIAQPSSRRRGRVDGEAAAQPFLTLDPYGRGVLLRLPAVSEAPDGRAVWVVTVGSQLQRVETQALWPGTSEPAPATEVSLPTPVRQATAALEGYEQLVSIVPVVDDAFPLLAFDESGRRMATGLPWREATAWLLFPGDEADLQVEGTLQISHRGSLPPGWAGWSLVLGDLSEVTTLSIGGAARVQAVRRAASARIIVAEPIPGMRTRAGGPVWTDAPGILLPGEAGPDAAWEVTLAASSGEVLATETYVGGGDASDAWDSLPRPLFGTYTVRVRGPWGRGSSRTVTVTEGLDVRFEPSWRRMTGSGLTPATVSMSGPPELQLDNTRLALGAQEMQAVARVGMRDEWRTLVVEPAHMSVTYQSAESVYGPTVRSMSLYAEDVCDAPGKLTVDIGMAAEPRLHVWSGEQHLQTIEPGADVRGGVCRFDLARVVDTIRAHPKCRLTLDPDGRLEVAAVRPRKLVSGLELVRGELAFDNAVDVPGLTAHVYALRAPWRGGHAIPIVDGRAPLPEVLRDAGPLSTTVRIDDPWAPEPVPSWPDAWEARLSLTGGHLVTDDAEETMLSAFLAGEGPLSSPVTDLPRLWTTVGLVKTLRLDERPAETRLALEQLLQENPASALVALPQCSLDTDMLPQTLIRAGLAWCPVAPGTFDPSQLDWSRRGIVASALLLPAMTAQEVTAAADAAGQVAGEALDAVLSGKDPHSKVGRYDTQTDMYDRMSSEQRELLKGAAAFIPAGLLSADARAQAALELLENRLDGRLSLVTRHAESTLEQVVRLLSMISSTAGLAAVNARRHPGDQRGWRSLPALSMGLAFAARHAARGNETAAGWVPRQRSIWVDLAKVTPDLVTIDLVLAELTLSATNATEVDET